MDADRKPELLVDLFPECQQSLSSFLEFPANRLGRTGFRIGVLDRCRCGDDFCGTFYTQPKPEGPYGPGVRSVALEPSTAYLIVDVVDGVAAQAEVLYRDEIHEKLLTTFPDKP